MFELKQKLTAAEVSHFLSPEEHLRLKIMWTVKSLKDGEEILKKFLNG